MISHETQLLLHLLYLPFTHCTKIYIFYKICIKTLLTRLSITHFMSHVTQNTLFIKICYMITCNVTSHIIEPIVLHCMQYTRHKKEEPQRGSSRSIKLLSSLIIHNLIMRSLRRMRIILP